MMDDIIFDYIDEEHHRQFYTLELIASENIVSSAVLQAQGSILTNRYAEGEASGLGSGRFYGGCEKVDLIERTAIERAKALFGANYANVQPHSGSQANQAVYFALLNHGDTVLGMKLDHGGHLTHGMKINQSGKNYNFISYGVNEEGLIDYDEVERLAKEHKPKMIVSGASAYSRIIDWERFREIADEVGALLFVDMAHYSGLIAAGHYPNPVRYADVVTSTTHKTLRGPRGGMILSNDIDIAKKLERAVFPGIQGGPLMHVIAAKAVCFREAMSEDFMIYSKDVINNAQALSNAMKDLGYDIVSGGTDCHMFLVDLSSKDITGARAQELLDSVGITCNKNTIPNDTRSPLETSGIRIGTPAITSRGFKPTMMSAIAQLIDMTLMTEGMTKAERTPILHRVQEEVRILCKRHPLPN